MRGGSYMIESGKIGIETISLNQNVTSSNFVKKLGYKTEASQGLLKTREILVYFKTVK